MTARSLWIAAVLAVAVCFAGLGRSLWSPDEPTGAAVGRAMLDSGDLVVPRLDGAPFLEKPPLYWWVQVASLRLLGVTPAAARLPSALFGLATLAVAWALGRRCGVDPPALAALVLATTALFVGEVCRVVVDPALMFFVALVHLGFARLAGPRDDRDRRGGLLLVAVALPFAFLAKGPVAIALGAVPAALWLLWTRRARAWRDLRPLLALGVPLFLLVVGPYVWALARHAGWGAVQELLLNNTTGRFTDTRRTIIYGHTAPPWYYLEVAPAFLLPWILALPAALAAGVLRAGSQRELEVRRMLAWTCAGGFLILSVAATKRELYLLPLVPAFAALIAWWLGQAARGTLRRATRRTFVALLGFAAALALVLGGALIAVRRLHGARWPAAPLQEALTPPLLAAAVAASLLVAGLALRPLVRLLQRRECPTPAAVLVPFLLLFLGVLGLQQLVDPIKRLDDLTSAIARHQPGDAPVDAYLFGKVSHEALVGSVEFALGRRTTVMTTPEAVAAHVAQRPGAPVVLRLEDLPTLPPPLRRDARLLYDESGRKALAYAIAVWPPPAPPPPSTGG